MKIGHATCPMRADIRPPEFKATSKPIVGATHTMQPWRCEACGTEIFVATENEAEDGR